MVDVTNRGELRAWLETQPREVISVFAARAALRVFPTLRRLDAHHNKLEHPLPAINDEARGPGSAASPCPG